MVVPKSGGGGGAGGGEGWRQVYGERGLCVILWGNRIGGRRGKVDSSQSIPATFCCNFGHHEMRGARKQEQGYFLGEKLGVLYRVERKIFLLG